MKLTLHNIRSLKSAEIAIHPQLTLIMGRNQAGKTTLLNTVAALMLGERNLYGATAKDATPVLRTGEEVASAAIGAADKWVRTLLWPAYEAGGSGESASVNEVTLGRVDPAGDFDAKGWAAFVRGISNAGGIKPSEIYDALAALDGSEDELNSLGPLLKQGWDVATKHCEDKRLAARRLWEQTTHEKFGTGKADGWMAPDLGKFPANFDAEIAELEETIKSLEDAARRADFKAELFDVSIPDLRADILTRGEQANEIGGDLEALRRKESELQAELSHYPHSDTLSCPHCGGIVDYKAGKLTEHKDGDHVRGSDEHKQLVADLGQVQNDIEAKSHERGKLVAAAEADRALLKRMEEVSK